MMCAAWWPVCEQGGRWRRDREENALRESASGAPRPDDLVALLHARGLRVTAQRLAVLEVLRDTAGHITAEDIFQQVADRLSSLSIVSVYRTLEFFAERGFVTRTSLGGRSQQWEWNAGDEHHHLICRGCGQRQEISGAYFAEAAARLQRDFGFQAELRHLAVWGICPPCRQLQEDGLIELS